MDEATNPENGSDTTRFVLELPGLELPDAPVGHIHASAVATLEALGRDGLLEDRHALTCQVVLGLAGAVDRGLAAARVTVATATLSKQLLEAIELLPSPEAAPSPEFDAFTAKLRAVS